MIRVGVLMGGRSIEREVSFNSGRTVCDHLDTSMFTIAPLFQTVCGTLYKLPWHFLHRGKISDFEHRLVHEAQPVAWDDLKALIDFIFIATHGRYAEDGTLQGMLELLGISYLGSGVYASALCMDKALQRTMLRHVGVIVPKTVLVPAHYIAHLHRYKDEIITSMYNADISFSCVVKPRAEGSSFGVYVVPNKEVLWQALDDASSISGDGYHDVLVEEYLIGMEFSCIALADKDSGKLIALPPTEIIPEPGTMIFDYEQKYMPGRATKRTPPNCSADVIAQIQHAVIKTAETLDIHTIARIDGFVTDDGRVVVVDPNTSSGMAPSSFLFREAAEVGMTHADVINHLILSSLKRVGIEKDDILTKQGGAMAHSVDQKKRVAVLLGGRSNEREISLESGRNVVYKLSPTKYEVIPVFLSSDLILYRLTQAQLVLNSTREIAHVVTDEQRIAWNDLPSLIDFAFIALHGGEGENGIVQGALDMLDIAYNGSGVLASSLCMDKYKTNCFLREHGFDVPQSVLVNEGAWHNNENVVIGEILEQLSFPLIVKPHDDGCSVMVEKVESKDELQKTISMIFDIGKKTKVLVEELIQGMELTVGVIGNEEPRAMPPSRAVSSAGVLSIKEKFLPGCGENQTPAPLTADVLSYIMRTMERAFKVIGCRGYARIDCFYQQGSESPTGNDRVVILEVNTLPGLTPATCIFHQAAEIGMRPMDFLDEIIFLGIQSRSLVKSKLNAEKEKVC